METYDGQPFQALDGDNPAADTREDRAFIVDILNSTAIPRRRGSFYNPSRSAGDVRGLRTSQRNVSPSVFFHGTKDDVTPGLTFQRS